VIRSKVDWECDAATNGAQLLIATANAYTEQATLNASLTTQYAVERKVCSAIYPVSTAAAAVFMDTGLTVSTTITSYGMIKTPDQKVLVYVCHIQTLAIPGSGQAVTQRISFQDFCLAYAGVTGTARLYRSLL